MKQTLPVSVMIGLAAYLAWLGISSPAGLHAPPLILFVLALAMLAGALGLWARSGGSKRLNGIFAAILLFCFAATGYWIGFSPNATGTCTISIGETINNDGSQPHGSGWTCRLVFGSGAVLSTVLGLMALLSLDGDDG
jgi:hypothetical protein